MQAHKDSTASEHHESVALTLGCAMALALVGSAPPQDSARAVALVQPSHGIALLPAPEAPVHMPGISEEGGEEEEAFESPKPGSCPHHRPQMAAATTPQSRQQRCG